MPHADELYARKRQGAQCQHVHQVISYPQGVRKVACRDCGAVLLSLSPKGNIWQMKGKKP